MTNKVILDSDFLYGLFVEDDVHHKICVQALPKIENSQILISNLVIYEMLTLLSRRVSQAAAQSFLEDIEMLGVQKIFIDQQVEAEILKQFLSYSKKNISFVDCSNLVLAKKYNTKIASFDRFYPAGFLI